MITPIDDYSLSCSLRVFSSFLSDIFVRKHLKSLSYNWKSVGWDRKRERSHIICTQKLRNLSVDCLRILPVIIPYRCAILYRTTVVVRIRNVNFFLSATVLMHSLIYLPIHALPSPLSGPSEEVNGTTTRIEAQTSPTRKTLVCSIAWRAQTLSASILISTLGSSLLRDVSVSVVCVWGRS